MTAGANPTSRADLGLWRHRRAAAVRPLDRVVLVVLFVAGVLSVLRFADWWFRAGHVASTALYVILSLAVWYGVVRIVLGWIDLLSVRRPGHRPAPEGLEVAIFTTAAPGEPPAMFETTLAACAEVRYPHTTYLLDDTRDPRLREIAEAHGAVWLELLDVAGAKAGKINAALAATDEEIVLVLDPDHVPFQEFLDRVLGHFDDPEVGFVQVAQGYYNQRRSFTARGAAEQTYAFYGPTMMGLHGHGSNVAIGANCTFRRSALESIGGHGIGLAEDLVTAIRLHAAGWRSVYVPEIVSRGLVPEDLGSFYRQQLKWSRGVWEVLFSELPRAWGGLSIRQRLAYAAIGTYYLFGVTTLAYLAIPYLYLWAGIQPASMRFADFVMNGAPVAMLAIAIYLYAQRWLTDRPRERGLHWRGLSLKVACWPVYLAGTALGILRREIPYVPTAKEARKGAFWTLAAPHLALLALYAVTLAWTFWRRTVGTPEAYLALTSEAVWGMVAFATASAAMVVGGVRAAWESRHPPVGGAWDAVPERVGGEA
ncbi:MAG TPA: glycosyltransferase family 2 protein [Gemmatimonadota bacterium]|nr:glycosyltransferase family 2 protein [Gemmatimonadota bacterium]